MYMQVFKGVVWIQYGKTKFLIEVGRKLLRVDDMDVFFDSNWIMKIQQWGDAKVFRFNGRFHFQTKHIHIKILL